MDDLPKSIYTSMATLLAKYMNEHSSAEDLAARNPTSKKQKQTRSAKGESYGLHKQSSHAGP